MWCTRVAITSCLITAVSLWTSTARVETPSPKIAPIELEALAGVPMRPIEDTQYWKLIVGDTDSPAASVSTFVSADKLFEAGVSQYDRITLELRDWPFDEFMYIVEGEVEITPAGGEPLIYGPGDAFVMPMGFRGTWKQLSSLKKFQVTYSTK